MSILLVLALLQQWQPGRSMPTPGYAFATGVIGGRIYAAGGMCNGQYPRLVVEAYDVDQDSWITGFAHLPVPHAYAGGAVGPELDGVGKKYAARGILESIVQPSKVISEQYQNTTLFLDDEEEDEVTGMIIGENDEEITLIVNGLANIRRTIAADQVIERSVSQLSPMPEGLVTILEKEEILDLLAYLISSGDPDDPIFQETE